VILKTKNKRRVIMEKKLVNMRKELKKKSYVLVTLIGFCTILLGIVISGVLPMQHTNEDIVNYLNGFQVGLLVTIDVFAAINLAKYHKALKDDTLCKRIYNEEHDERKILAVQKAGKDSTTVSKVVILVAAVISGYFSAPVFAALVSAMFIESVINIFFKNKYLRAVESEIDTEE